MTHPPTTTEPRVARARPYVPRRLTDQPVLADALHTTCAHYATATASPSAPWPENLNVSTARLRRLIETSRDLRLRDGTSVRRHLGLTWSRGPANPRTGSDTHLVRDEYLHVEHIHR